MFAKPALVQKSLMVRQRTLLFHKLILVHEVRGCRGDDGIASMAAERAKLLMWLLEYGDCFLQAISVERMAAEQRLRLNLYMEHGTNDAPTLSPLQPPHRHARD
jgi:hypothetical protein